MFDILLNHLRLRFDKSQVQPIHPPEDDFTRLWACPHLKSPQTRQLHATRAVASAWQLPLPFDVVFTIVENYLLEDEPTLFSLSRTCRSLAECCRPLRYRTVTISTYSRVTPTSLERFACFLAHSPDIVNYIHRLRLLDHGRMFQGSRPITVEERCLCYILARPFPNLIRLEMSLHVVWSLVPLQVQKAFETAFSLSTLREVMFEHVRIPAGLLSSFKHLKSLEILGEVEKPLESGDYFLPCAPERILLVDGSRSGFVTENLFHAQSRIALSKIKTLIIHTQGIHIHLLNSLFRKCGRTITCLELYLSTWRELTSVLDLRDLPQLNSLTLTTDFNRVAYGRSYSTSGSQYTWLVHSLATCIALHPSLIQKIHIITYSSLAFSEEFPWSEFDTLFTPTLKTRWPNLDLIQITKIEDKCTFKNRSPSVPTTSLERAGILRFQTLDRWIWDA